MTDALFSRTMKRELKAIQEELDSFQVWVIFEQVGDAVRIYAKSLADKLIAKKELRRHGIEIIE